jgi:hypothetical protein
MSAMLLLSGADVERLLTPEACIVSPSVRARASDFTQELPRKLLPTGAKETPSRSREKRLICDVFFVAPWLQSRFEKGA